MIVSKGDLRLSLTLGHVNKKTFHKVFKASEQRDAIKQGLAIKSMIETEDKKSLSRFFNAKIDVDDITYNKLELYVYRYKEPTPLKKIKSGEYEGAWNLWRRNGLTFHQNMMVVQEHE